MSKLKNIIPTPTFFAVAIAIAVFFIKFTSHILNPFNTDWIMQLGDGTTEYLSWQFYRNTPWHFPVIGTLIGYDYPTVTGIGLTGAIPLLAIPFKIISPLLPFDFQYFGFWYLACYILQAVFAVRLLRGVSAASSIRITPIELVFGATILILAPALLTRSGHINLCAQWLILWSLCVYFEQKMVQQKFYEFLKIIALTALIHQYLLLMVFGLAFATYWKSEKIGRLSWVKKGSMSIAGLLLAMVLWYFVGNFNTATGTMTQIGFGRFSANLNTFFNGQGEQFLMPSLPVNEGQYEGQGYLGISVLIMGLSAFLAFFLSKNKESKRKWSFSPLEARFMIKNAPFLFLSQAFRSSGRFIWVADYVLMATFIVRFLKNMAHRLTGIIALGVLTVLQVIDVSPMLTREHKYYDFDGYDPSVMTPKIWQQITREAERLVMLPLYTWHYKTNDDYVHFARIAALNHQSITTGYLARPDWDAHAAYEKKLFASLDKGTLGDESNSIFIATRHSFQKLKKSVESGQIKAFVYEDYVIGVPLKFEKTLKLLSELPNCKPANFDTEGLAEFIEHHANETILAVVKDDGAWKLCEDAKVQFRKMGSTEIANFALRGGLTMVINSGKIVFEKVSPEKEAIVQKFKTGDNLNGFALKTDLELHSAGGLAGNFGRIIINGKDYCLNQRGFNLVVLDKDFNVVKKAFFDTFDDCYSGEVK